MLEVKNVGVVLGGRSILRDINFRVDEGSFTGLIGPNGAGKTTLLRVILGLIRPTRGEVVVDGHQVRRGINSVGYVPQKIRLDADVPLRGRDLIGLGIDGDRWGMPIPNRTRRARVDRILEQVGAQEFAGVPIGRLSGGQQQRLLIGHALVAEPQLLLLDEPLSNLDIKSVHEVVRLVAQMVGEQGISALLVSHDMNPLLGVMDQVIYVANGRALMGSVDEVIQPDVLSRLYGYDVEVLRTQGRILVVSGNDQPHHDDIPGPGDYIGGMSR